MKLLLYCTKCKPYLYKTEDTTYPAYPIGYHTDKDLKVKLSNTNELANLNGKIVAECDFEVEKIEKKCVDVFKYCYITDTLNEFELMNKTQLDGNTTNNYLKGKNGYAIHIKNLHIFDKPIKLEKCHKDDFSNLVNYAPQNMMYSWLYIDKWTRYILISIKPQWLCKILNGEKTIEVRKKVLKGMIKNE